MVNIDWEKGKRRSLLARPNNNVISATEAQRTLIRSLSKEVGAKYDPPKSKAHASIIIQRLANAKKKGVVPKKRRPAVPIKGKFSRR